MLGVGESGLFQGISLSVTNMGELGFPSASRARHVHTRGRQSAASRTSLVFPTLAWVPAHTCTAALPAKDTERVSVFSVVQF